MAEFCLECLNKLNGTSDPPEKYILSKEPDFCEECGSFKPVVVRIRHRFGIVKVMCDLLKDSKFSNK